MSQNVLGDSGKDVHLLLIYIDGGGYIEGGSELQ